MSFILIAVGLFLLVKSADLFVDGCSNIAKALGIPPLIIGLTIVAFGTSAPETAVSVSASIKGLNDISLGNVVGSNICNLLLVLGFSSLAGTICTKRKVLTRDFMYVIFSGILLFIMGFRYFGRGGVKAVINRLDGVILLLLLVLYLYVLIKDAIKSVKKNDVKSEFSFKDVIFAVIGLIGIIFGGQLVVNSATEVAKVLGVSQSVIALTIVAIGTSLPELVTSVVASKKGEDDIAIGNVVGSNIFNVFFILGLSSVINPIIYDMNSFIDIIIMLFSSVLVYVLIARGLKLEKKKGIFLLLVYALYMIYILRR